MKTNPSIGGSIWTYEDMTRLDIMITPERIYIFYSILLPTLSKYTFRLREETLKQFNTSRRSGNHEVMTGIIEKISFQIPLPFHFTTSNCFLLLALLSFFIFTTIYQQSWQCCHIVGLKFLANFVLLLQPGCYMCLQG